MTTRSHVHQEDFPASPEQLFALLVTPARIRKWWGADQVIVLPEVDGIWAAVWGTDENDPDYITVACIAVYQPPCRLVLDKYRYRSRFGPLPFDAEFSTTFEVLPTPNGACLKVTQSGFPVKPEADEYFAACKDGWVATFEGIRKLLATAME